MSREYSPKEKAVYEAVLMLFLEGADLNNLTVSEITQRAGIGKGTVYEYFSDKEEMIAKALFYHISDFCETVYEQINQEKNFYHRMMCLLKTMEQKAGNSCCIFRLIHTVTGNSSISQKMHDMGSNKENGRMMVDDLFRIIITDEAGEKALSKETLVYLTSSTLSKVLCYGMIRNNPCHETDFEIEAVREMICRGIDREVREGIKNDGK